MPIVQIKTPNQPTNRKQRGCLVAWSVGGWVGWRVGGLGWSGKNLLLPHPLPPSHTSSSHIISPTSSVNTSVEASVSKERFAMMILPRAHLHVQDISRRRPEAGCGISPRRPQSNRTTAYRFASRRSCRDSPASSCTSCKGTDSKMSPLKAISSGTLCTTWFLRHCAACAGSLSVHLVTCHLCLCH